MAIIASNKGGGDFELIPEGTHLAACYLLVDLGMQESVYGAKHKMIVGWEVPDHTIERDGVREPMTVHAFYTVSLNEKANLRQVLEGWRGRAFTEQELEGFDVSKILGAPCMISVHHKQKDQKTSQIVGNVMALPPGVPKPSASRTIIYDNDNQDSFKDLPEWIQKNIKPDAPVATPAAQAGVEAMRGSLEPKPSAPAEVADSVAGGTGFDPNDDIPF